MPFDTEELYLFPTLLIVRCFHGWNLTAKFLESDKIELNFLFNGEHVYRKWNENEVYWHILTEATTKLHLLCIKKSTCFKFIICTALTHGLKSIVRILVLIYINISKLKIQFL